MALFYQFGLPASRAKRKELLTVNNRIGICLHSIEEEKTMIIRLVDIHTDRDFDLAFEARYTTEADGEVQITMHPSQLRSLAEDIEAVVADLPAEEEENSPTGSQGAVATVLPAVRVEPRAAPDPIREILRQIYAWRGAA
jgi:hypothetical protein